MNTCNAAIRPLPNAEHTGAGDTEIRCALDGEHTTHSGTLRDYAFPGSETVIDWEDDDRRSYRGEYPGECSDPKYYLPAGHPRAHHSW